MAGELIRLMGILAQVAPTQPKPTEDDLEREITGDTPPKPAEAAKPAEEKPEKKDDKKLLPYVRIGPTFRIPGISTFGAGDPFCLDTAGFSLCEDVSSPFLLGASLVIQAVFANAFGVGLESGFNWISGVDGTPTNGQALFSIQARAEAVFLSPNMLILPRRSKQVLHLQQAMSGLRRETLTVG